MKILIAVLILGEDQFTLIFYDNGEYALKCTSALGWRFIGSGNLNRLHERKNLEEK